MLSLLIGLANAFPTFSTKVDWGTMPNLITNVGYEIQYTVHFPSSATEIKNHPLAIDNPGPRADIYNIMYELAYANGTTFRTLFMHEVSAENGKLNSGATLYLPSYVISSDKTAEQFKIKATLNNMDSLIDILGGFKTVSFSPAFTMSKASVDQVQVDDKEFIKDGDLKDGKHVTILRYPQGKLLKMEIRNSGYSLSSQDQDF